MNKKMIDKTVCILFLFFVLYVPPILNINMIYIMDMIGVTFMIGWSITGKKILLDKFTTKLILGLLFLIIYEIIVGLVNGFGIYDSTNDLLIILFGFVFCSIVLRNFCIQKKITNKEFIEALFYAALLQAMFCIIAYLFPSFQKWFINKMISYGYSDTRFSQLSAFRWYGMASQLGYATPAVQTFFSIFALYKGFFGEKKYYIYSVFLLFSAIINARISVILFLVGIICIMFALLKNQGSKTLVKRMLLILILGVFIAVILLSIMKKISYANYKWLVNGLLSFIGMDVNLDGVYAVGNYFYDSNNMQLPTGLSLFIGYGVFSYRINGGFTTDIGFINDIWKYGIAVSLVLYYCIVKMVERMKYIGVSSDGFMVNLWIALFFISNIKGIVIAATPLFSLFIIMICALPCYNYIGVSQYEK